MSPDPAVTTSLRRSLLRRLAAPLSMLALMSGLIAYWLAWQYTQHVIDRFLVARGIDMDVAAEAMALADEQIAHALVDVDVPRGELVQPAV